MNKDFSFQFSNLSFRKASVRLFLVFLLGLQIFTLACLSSNQNSNTPNSEQTTVEIPAANIDPAKPLEISQKPEDVQLAKKIDEIIEKSEFANARWGVFVVSLRDGRVLASRDGRKLFNPASTQKLLTATVALDRLGADFRWQTVVNTSKNIENGVLDGDLILYGQGAPDLSDAGLENLANQLKEKGLQRVKGNLVGDESFFTGDNLGDGWTWNEVQWYYGAEASALSINFNYANLALQNGRPTASTDFVEVSGETKPAENVEAVGVKRELGSNKIYVWGEGKTLDVRVAVQNPALWSAKIFKDILQKKGITVEGAVRSADWKTSEKTDETKMIELARVQSATLGEIVRRMNKDSVNLYAELILRTLGKKFGPEAPDENPKVQKTRGDDAAGAGVIKKWLVEKGLSTDEIKIHDGSGLSRLDFLTPEALARTLLYASQAKFAAVFNDSLPVSGTDGTLRGRLPNKSGRILAKTGSITYVNTLAGFAKRPDETLAFVIFCNNETRKNDSSPVIDELAANLLN